VAKLDKSIIKNALGEIETIVGKNGILVKPVDLVSYKDSPPMSGPKPLAVVFPNSNEDVIKILTITNKYNIPVIARGAGTNLSAGILSSEEGNIILETAKMDKILEVNIQDRYILVEPGVSNIAVQDALKPYGYFYAPDPASLLCSTIGGNIAENAGGMHCVKYGVTSTNVLGVEFVLGDGQTVVSNGPLESDGQYNLTGLINGSEGTFGIVTKAWLKIQKTTEEVKTLIGVFTNVDDACKSVSDIIRQGITPCCIEFIDHLAINALEQVTPVGYPLDSEVLLVELDGYEGTLDSQVAEIDSILKKHNAKETRIAKTDEEREKLWLGRRKGQDCLISMHPGSYLQSDPAVPPGNLAEMLGIINKLGKKYNLVISSIAHAGDGNFHPQLLYDDKNEEETKRAKQCFDEVNKYCIKLNGTISGEHGIGLEKIGSMKDQFNNDELSYMSRVKLAFDPKTMLNPGKVIPNDIYQEEDKKVKELPNEYRKNPNLSSFMNVTEIKNIHKLDSDNYVIEGKKAGCVLKPSNVNEVATIVKQANKYDLDIVPLGKGSKISAANIGPNCVVINMGGLNKIADLDHDNVTVTVEAGIQLKVLQDTLNSKGYMLPVDPIGRDEHTIGGLIATNSTGSLILKYGSFKNLVLGLQAVTSAGKIINYGGKMLKNVAGYDLRKLFIGSWGTLGIITQVIMKMHIMPEKAAYRTYITNNYKSFLDFINAVQNADFYLTSFDFVVHDSKYYVNLCMSGKKLSVEMQEKILEGLVGNDIRLLEEIDDTKLASGNEFFNKYADVSDSKNISIKSCILFSNIPEWINEIYSFAKHEEIVIYGNMANGIVYAVINDAHGETAKNIEDIKARLDHAFAFGTHTVEIGSSSQPRIDNKNNNIINQRLKKILDPKNILNPGVALGGRKI
jgi:glycolate oxidase